MRYRFRARLLPLDHWLVEPATGTRTGSGIRTALDAPQLVRDVRSFLAIDDETLPVYLEEIASTLAGRAWKARPEAPTSTDLLQAGFQDVEAAMTEGHPCFVANNGRLGLGAGDYLAYAPETAAPVRLVWLAVRRDRSVFSAVRGLSYDDLLAHEFDAPTLATYERRLRDLDLGPADYRLMPCHPWQWDHKIAVTFAPDVARRDIVCLGPATTTSRRSSRCARSSTGRGPTGTT